MTTQKKLKRKVRERSAKTGESYAAARAKLLAGAELPVAAADDHPPSGWIAAGSAPGDYEMRTDRAHPRGERPSAVIQSRVDNPRGFGTLMQTILADDYRGKRVRLRAWVETRDVVSWCGLWMRVDGEAKQMLAFDNMQSRPIRGTVEWKRYDVVLDVAPGATAIAFGILLDGLGSAWLNEVAIEVVGDDVPTTNTSNAPSRNPRNLTFEE